MTNNYKPYGSKNSIEPRGIFLSVGDTGTGKTIFAIGAYPTKNTAYLYDDVKEFTLSGMNTDEVKSNFALFINLRDKYPREKYKLLGYYKALKEEFDNIPNNIDSIIFDTWTRIGKAIRAYAEHNPYKFREEETFTRQKVIAIMEKKGDSAKVEIDIVSQLKKKCKALFLIAHIKPLYDKDEPTGLDIPDLHKNHKRACNASFWFKRNKYNPNSGVPVALVLKRMAKITLDDNGIIQPVNFLPQKIVPLDNEKSVWDAINRYWHNDPISNREPTELEIPTNEEVGILEGTLTKDQKEIWKMRIRAQQEQVKQEQVFFDNQMKKIKQEAIALHVNNKPNPLPVPFIHNELVVKYHNLSREQVSKWIEEYKKNQYRSRNFTK